MKGIWGLAAVLLCGVCIAGGTKEVIFHFDPTRLTMETRGNATLFRYNDPACKYVEHEQGAPVLPAVLFHVLMPRDAVYQRSRVRAESQPYRGVYRLFTRGAPAAATRTAKRYPASLIEFVGHRDIEGFRVFTFRGYPVCCQPADGSVVRILKVTMMVNYTAKDSQRMYAPVARDVAARIKQLVINPDDLELFTVREPRGRTKGGVAEPAAASSPLFATHIRDRNAAQNASVNADVFDFLKENVYINEENDIVYAPFRF